MRRAWEEDADEPPLPLERALKEVRAIYRQADEAYLPFSCPASGECCQLAATKRPPWLWGPEWELLRRGRALPPARADGGCPYLDAVGKRCTAYADRPLGCRTFFCERIRGPARQPRDVLNALSKRLEQLSLRLFPEQGPKPLPEWHAEAGTEQEHGEASILGVAPLKPEGPCEVSPDGAPPFGVSGRSSVTPPAHG